MERKLSDILVLCDMDGTLLTREKRVSSANLSAIRLFTMLGGHFTVATGRVPESVSRYTDLVGLLEPVVASGGCVIYDFKDDRICSNFLLPRMEANKALREIGVQFPQVGIMVFGGDERVYVLSASQESQRLLNDERITYFLHPLEDLPPFWNKVLFAGPPALLQQIERFVAGQSYQGIYFVFTDPCYYEMMPRGISKGSGVGQLCELLNLRMRDTWAIGDYYNDIDLMRSARHTVAMANAPAEIRQMADEVTADCDESGVGQFLYKLIKRYVG